MVDRNIDEDCRVIYANLLSRGHLTRSRISSITGVFDESRLNRALDYLVSKSCISLSKDKEHRSLDSYFALNI